MKLAKHILSVVVFLFVALSFIFLAERGMSATDKAQTSMDRVHPVNDENHFVGGPLVIALPQEVWPPNVSSEVYFCQERMPLEFTDIHERFDQELLRNTYWHSSTLLNMKRLGKYFDAISAMFDRYNIPPDVRYLAIAESNLSNVVSPAGAAGYWQFMKATGSSYGLEISSEVDERYHFEKATEAACLFLRDLHRQITHDFPNTKTPWTLAAAAYNMGYPALKSAMTQQRVDNYYDLHLNQETARYVFRITAFKVILEHPEDFGYSLSQNDLYAMEETYTVSVDTTLRDLTDFALSQGTTLKELKRLNPWLRSNTLTASPLKPYVITLSSEPQVHQD
ncbi:MAG: lytic transglycosylase domain-containing protein [Bacteroidota bacterium]|nr:lytic transglycosylase domain-containing protein [Bacteroidota bacterium]